MITNSQLTPRKSLSKQFVSQGRLALRSVIDGCVLFWDVYAEDTVQVSDTIILVNKTTVYENILNLICLVWKVQVSLFPLISWSTHWSLLRKVFSLTCVFGRCHLSPEWPLSDLSFPRVPEPLIYLCPKRWGSRPDRWRLSKDVERCRRRMVGRSYVSECSFVGCVGRMRFGTSTPSYTWTTLTIKCFRMGR